MSRRRNAVKARIRQLKARIEQWRREGYDVSELDDLLRDYMATSPQSSRFWTKGLVTKAILTLIVISILALLGVVLIYGGFLQQGGTSITPTPTPTPVSTIVATPSPTPTLTTAPTVNITASPAPPSGCQQVTYTATASSPSGIDRIQIWIDGQLKHECFGSTSCSYTEGPYYQARQLSYEARARDMDGKEGFVAPKVFQITSPCP